MWTYSTAMYIYIYIHTHIYIYIQEIPNRTFKQTPLTPKKSSRPKVFFPKKTMIVMEGSSHNRPTILLSALTWHWSFCWWRDQPPLCWRCNQSSIAIWRWWCRNLRAHTHIRISICILHAWRASTNMYILIISKQQLHSMSQRIVQLVPALV